MANIITRTIATKTTITGYQVEIVNNEPHILKMGPIEVAGTVTDAQARRALKNAGYIVARGTQVNIQEGEKKTYGMTVEDFMKYAKLVVDGKLVD